MATAKFTWPAKEVFDEEIQTQTLITRFKSGKEQRRSKGLPRRRWVLGFEKDEVNSKEIWDFFKDRKGEFESFEWDLPDGSETVKVRLDIPTMKWTNQYYLQFDFTLAFIEVF